MTNENDFEIIVKSRNINNELDNLSDIIKWQGKFETKIYNKKKISKKTNIPNLKTNLNLINFFKTVQEEIYLEPRNDTSNLVNYLNVEKFAKALAITLLFADTHSVQNSNSRYYVNPYTLKIEPILTDIAHGRLDDIYIKRIINEYGVFYSSLFEMESFQKTYYKTLLEIKSEFYIISDRLNEICSKFGKNCFNEIEKDLVKDNLDRLIKIGNKIFSYAKNKDNLEVTSDFNTTNKFDLIEKKIHFRSYFDNSIDLINLTSEMLRIENIQLIKDEKCKKNCKYETSFDFLLKPSSFIKASKFSIFLKQNFKDFSSIKISYIDEKGKKFSVTEKIEKRTFSFEKYKDSYFDDKNGVLISKDNDLIIKKGTYNISKPIIIPDGKNLIIESGTKLNMSKNTYIFVSNGNLDVLGNANDKVIIKNNKDHYWSGIFVRSDNKKNSQSNINHTVIKNYTYFDNGLIQLTGGINFYNTNINIENLDLENTLAEDGINIVNSKFTIDNLNAINTKSDAVDIDFSKGEILNSEFTNIGGDGIDFSGSNSNILKVKIDDVKDKAISVGEKSFIKLKDINITKSSIGIASKDSSKVIGENVITTNCILHDYASFQKKSFFSKGFIELNNSKGCNKELVEKNSYLSVNGKVYEGKEIDIKKEYY